MPDVESLTEFPPVPPGPSVGGRQSPVGLERQPIRRAPDKRQPDERPARRELRAQIARLEHDLAEALVSSFPRGGVDASLPVAPRRAGPRLLGLGELEAIRDALASRLARARGQLSEQAEREERSRVLLERMLLEPGRYKFVRIPCADLGQRGCGEWHVRPRFGIIGMLAGWWQVKLSSGCPLPKGLPRPGSPAPPAIR